MGIELSDEPMLCPLCKRPKVLVEQSSGDDDGQPWASQDWKCPVHSPSETQGQEPSGD
ncbi:hypothetical protein ACIRF8_12740 [Streptomyces sp. NPDC102406]|uniref:hypothetical protein n=1 Tax=Streptomyces sp. NPDC102406 TaxID=3366171 RepID=UPI0038215CDE